LEFWAFKKIRFEECGGIDKVENVPMSWKAFFYVLEKDLNAINEQW
jgi:hypothetical protein